VSHEDFNQELNALRENLPTTVEEAVASKSVEKMFYSHELAERIIDAYSQGTSLLAISRKSEMPAYSTLLKWSKNHPEFSKMLRAVREARALHFEDAAIEAAENAQGKDADRLKFEAYKWGAEVNDPATYGKKLAHSGQLAGGITLQVVTGFGPPNEWQTPPKLNADGTIDKSPPKDVESEVVDEKPRPVGESRDEKDALGTEDPGTKSP
jgi:hypothetical protein